MKEWADKIELLEKARQARWDARESCPRGAGNDAIEVAMFLAQLEAVLPGVLASAARIASEMLAQQQPEDGSTDAPAGQDLPAVTPVTETLKPPEVSYDTSG